MESQKSKSAKRSSEQPPEEKSEAQSTSNKEIVSSQGTAKDISQDYTFEIIELENHEPLQTTFEDGEQINVVQLFYPDKCKLGQLQGE